MIYIGSYSDPSGYGIYSFNINYETGRLTPAGVPIQAVNPSYLIASSDHRFCYTVSETTKFQGMEGGSVSAYRIDDTGSLVYQNTVATGGRDPCHLSTDSCGTILAAANYSSGSFSLFPLNNGIIGSRTTLISHQGSGPDKNRQEMAHVHFTSFTPDEQYLCAVDLGSDSVIFYRLNMTKHTLSAQNDLTITLQPGSGPRHLLFNGRLLYIITELSSEIAVWEYTGERTVFRQIISTIPSEYNGFSAAAALKISPDHRFLYASNRGHDSIAVFRIQNDGLLSLAAWYSSEGEWPRDIALDPQGKFLAAANEKSHEVVLFSVNKETGALMKTDCTSVHSPTCILIV